MIDPTPIRPGDTVFLGDSLTESFDLKKHFGREDLRNRGMAGNLTDHVLYRMEEIPGKQPARLFLMIGINDLFAGQSPERILENIRTIVDHFSEKAPETVLFLQSILPVNLTQMFEDEGINLKIYALNHDLERLCKKRENRTFINLHPEFLGVDGEMDTAYTFDGVHLTSRGYDLWARLVRPYLGS
jgi:lysophospholipase L1-like esterase